MFTYWLIGMALEIQWGVRVIIKHMKVNKGFKPSVLDIIVALLISTLNAWLWPLEIAARLHYLILHENDDTHKL